MKKSSSRERSGNSASSRRKATLYDDLDATATPQSSTLFQDLDAGDDLSSLTSLSSLSEGDFEDVPLTKRQKVEDSDDDEDIEFEDVAAHRTYCLMLR